MMNILEKQNLSALFEGEPEPLESEEEIEDLILAIGGFERDVEFYKRLKKRRVEQIDLEIRKAQFSQERFREIIKLTLKKTGRKSLKFPGVGKVSTRKNKGTWTIDDENGLLDYLKDNLSEEDYNHLVKTDIKLVKSNVNKVLDVLERSGEVPEMVKREDDKISISVSVDERSYDLDDQSPSEYNEELDDVLDDDVLDDADLVKDLDRLELDE